MFVFVSWGSGGTVQRSQRHLSGRICQSIFWGPVQWKGATLFFIHSCFLVCLFYAFLKLFCSILCWRGDFSSSLAPLPPSMPQQSTFRACTCAFRIYYKKHFHCFAEEVQFYTPVKSDANDSLETLSSCSNDIKTWLDLFICVLVKQD